MDMNHRSGCLVVVLTLVIPVLILAGFTGWGFLNTIKTPEEVEFEIRGSPNSIGIGDSFLIEVQITNLAAQSQRLTNIDFSNEYLEGITVEQSEPPFTKIESFPDWKTYSYANDIGSNETLVVEFSTVGGKSGVYPGWIGICINRSAHCIRFDGTVVVD